MRLKKTRTPKQKQKQKNRQKITKPENIPKRHSNYKFPMWRRKLSVSDGNTLCRAVCMHFG